MKKTKINVRQRYLESMLTVRVPSILIKKLSASALREGISRSNLVRKMFELYLDNKVSK